MQAAGCELSGSFVFPKAGLKRSIAFQAGTMDGSVCRPEHWGGMEVIRGTSKCAICHRVIAERDDIVATTRFISDESHPLWRFSQEPLHIGCFQTWEKRSDFVDKYSVELEKRVLESIDFCGN
jgi:hypothetical protein